MLIKLMKQDFRATGRIMLPLYLAALVLSGLTRIGIAVQHSHLNPQSMGFWDVFIGIITFLMGLSIFALVVATFVLMILRFYKNYTTDEGYLMFTLPVRTSELIFSKLIVALVWYLCTAVIVLIMSLILRAGGGLEFSTDFSDFALFTGAQRSGLVMAGLVCLLSYGISRCLMFYACMGVGQSFNRRKIFMMVVFFFVFSIASNILNSIFTANGFLSIQNAFVYTIDELGGQLFEPMMKMLWTTTIVQLCWSVVYYFLTHLMLSKRLNLQ